MKDKIVLYQDLTRQFPTLMGDLERLGLEVQILGGGREIADQVPELRPHFVVLDLAMPGFSGIECCRQIKSTMGEKSPRVILVSAFSSSIVRERSQDAGCDLFVFPSEAVQRITDFVISEADVEISIPVQSEEQEAEEASLKEAAAGLEDTHQSEQSEVVPTISTRTDIPGPLPYRFDQIENVGWSINASETGILVAVRNVIPDGTEVTVRCPMPEGNEFELTGVVVRGLTLKAQVQNLSYAVGLRFQELSEPDREKLLQFIEARSYQASTKFTPELLSQIFERAEDFVNESLVREELPPELRTYVEELRPYELNSFSQDGPIPQCIRTLVGLRLQCTAFRVFLPSLKANMLSMGPKYLPILDKILERSDAIENDVDLLVRDAVLRGDDEARQSLNDISNRLYQAKIKLLYAVDEAISAKSVPTDFASYIEKVNSKVQALQAVATRVPEVVKYSRKPTAPTPKFKKDVKKETKREAPAKKTDEGSFLDNPTVRAFLILFFVGALLVQFWFWKPKKIRVEGFVPSIAMDKVDSDEAGMLLFTRWQLWRNLPRRAINDFYRKLNAYMRVNKIRQAKIMDENGNLIAISIGAETPTGEWIFSNRQERR